MSVVSTHFTAATGEVPFQTDTTSKLCLHRIIAGYTENPRRYKDLTLACRIPDTAGILTKLSNTKPVSNPVSARSEEDLLEGVANSLHHLHRWCVGRCREETNMLIIFEHPPRQACQGHVSRVMNKPLLCGVSRHIIHE